MTIIEKDILTVESGIICHQVNCQGVMGSGIALAIKNKWPVVFDEYNRYVKSNKDFTFLGKLQIVDVGRKLSVANIFGQLYFGGSERQTDYGALNRAFAALGLYEGEQIYFPYKFGSDRGGGDWNIVSQMIEHYIPTAIICKLP